MDALYPSFNFSRIGVNDTYRLIQVLKRGPLVYQSRDCENDGENESDGDV